MVRTSRSWPLLFMLCMFQYATHCMGKEKAFFFTFSLYVCDRYPIVRQLHSNQQTITILSRHD